MKHRRAEWQLPAGVSRGLWDYILDRQCARQFDKSLRDAPLVQSDCRFVQRHCPKPGRLLDLGCGTGRTLIPLAKAGYWALGVDLSTEMLRAARDKAQAEGVRIQLLKANIVELDALADASFDYVTCLFSTLGMVRGADNRRRVLQHACRLLRAGGVFVVHVHNRWFNLRDKNGRKWLIADVVRAMRGSPVAGDRPMNPDGEPPFWSLHHFTRREITRLMRAAGFELREVKPVSAAGDGDLRAPRWFPQLRAYGYLLAGRRLEAAATNYCARSR